MPILSKVGRKTPGQRAARTVFYTLLVSGAVVILYPMALVVGQAVSNRYDLRDNAIVPRYLYDRNELALKHIFSMTKKMNLLASRYRLNDWRSHATMRRDRDFFSRQPERFAEQGFPFEKRDIILADFNAFKETMNPDDLVAREFRVEDYYYDFVRRRFHAAAETLRKEMDEGRPIPQWLPRAYPKERNLRRVLRSRSRLALAIMNHEFRADYPSILSLEVIGAGNLMVPVWRPKNDPKGVMWRDFMESLPPGRKMVVRSDTYWHDYLRMRYNDNIRALNEAWETDHKGFYEIVMPFAPPGHPAVRRDWERFIVRRWPRRLLRLPPDCAPEWRRVLRDKLHARVGGPEATRDTRALAELSRLEDRPVERWEDAEAPLVRPANDTLSRFWCEFTFSGAVPAEAMILDTPEQGFRRFLAARYGDGNPDRAVDALNRAWGSRFASLDDVPLPLSLSDYVEPAEHPWRLRWSFAAESFQRVFEYLIGRGRAVPNTIILISLSLLSALTVNPMAAYSLSRFTMKQSHKILLFFLATMAFPPAVSMIPVFLLLRDLHLLNTYAALVLPTMANGYSIFLLKCFFDSLPKELYEAAEIDGATELQTFRLVAVPLIKPILAYIALMTFVAAYNGFMWAFVICPEQKMWTIMVWVFDFQSRNPGYNYVMASVLLAAIAPLIVFICVNRIIMKGIMIPQMK